MGKFIARTIYLTWVIPAGLFMLPMLFVVGGFIWVMHNGQKDKEYVGYWAIMKDCPLPPINGSGKGGYLV